MMVKVARAKQDFNDKSITLSTAIISILNADFNNDYTKENLLVWMVPVGVLYAVMHTGNFVNA